MDKQLEKNPLEKWYLVTQSPKWKELSDQEKSLAKERFVEKYSQGSDIVRPFLEYATIPASELFSREDFKSLTKEDQLRAIKANKVAQEGFKETDFGKNDFTRAFKSGDKAVQKAYEKDYLRTQETVLRSLEKGSSAALAQKVQEYVPDEVVDAAKAVPGVGSLLYSLKKYRGGKEGTTKFMQETSELQSRDKGVPLKIPGVYDTGYRANKYDVAEMAPSIAVGSATGPIGAATKAAPAVVGTSLAKRAMARLSRLLPQAAVTSAESAALTPVTPSKGASPEQQSQEIRRGTELAAAVGGGSQLVSDIATSPAVQEILGNNLRWLKARLSMSGKRADIADDYLRGVKESQLDIGKQAARRSEVVAEPSRAEVLATVQKEQAALINTPDAVWTGSPQAAPELGNLQLQSGGLDTGEVLQELEAKVEKPLNKLAGMKSESFADASEYVQRQYLPANAKAAVLQKNNIIQAEDAVLKENLKNIWGTARESGILSTSTGISQKQYMARIDDALKGLPKKEKEKLKSLITRPKPTKGGVTFDHVVLDKMDLLGAKTPQNAAYIDTLVSVQDSILGDTALPEIATLFQRTTQEEVAAKSRIAEAVKNLDIDKKIETGFAKEPILKAFSKGGSADTIVQSVFDPLTDINKVQTVLKDPVLGPKLKTAIVSDIADTLNLRNKETKEVALRTLYNKYSGREDVVRAVLGSPGLVKRFDTLMQIGKSQGQFMKQAGQIPMNNSRTAKQAARGTLTQTVGATSQLAGATVEVISNAFNSETRKMLNQTAFDKKLALQILNKAENIQKGRISYKEMYDSLQGIRKGTTAASTGIGAQGVEYNDSPEPPATTPQEPAQDSVGGGAAQDTLGLTNTENNGSIEEDLVKVNINPKFESLVYDIAGIESTFNPDTGLGNTKSSAMGPFQIIDGTWDYVTKDLGLEEQLGRPLDRANLQDNTLVAAAYANHNYKELKKVGVQGSAPNLYVAHAWGLAGAKKLFKYQGKDVAIEDVMPAEAINGHPLFAKPGMSVDEVLYNTKKHFSDRRNAKGKEAFVTKAKGNG